MSEHIGWAILIAAVVTAVIRASPVIFLAHRSFPVALQYWLHFVPASILSAIIAAEVISKPQTTSFGMSVAIMAVIAAFLIGFITRSLFATVIASIVAYLIFQNL